MSDVTPIFDGNIVIYRTTHSGDVWQFRMYVQDEQRYVRKSLKTRDKEVAEDHARKEFIRYQSKIDQGEKLFSISAKELRENYLAHIQERVDGGQLSDGRLTNIKTHTKHYIEFVGAASKIQNIDKKLFRTYRAFRQKKVSDITMSTVVNETISIKQMYRYAVEEGFIGQTYKPDFGEIKVPLDEVRRDGFTIEEYRQLVSISKLWHKNVPAAHPKRDEEIYYRRLLNDFVILQANLGLRTQELHSLRFSDVKVLADEKASVLVRAANTKIRKSREVIGRRGDVFDRIKSYTKSSTPDDFVFQHFSRRDKLPREVLYEYFTKLKSAVKEKYGAFDDSKTLYSLRHFWITIHLLAGTDVYMIARYAGTSLTQIEKHYDNATGLQVSRNVLKTKIKFDQNNQIVLDD